MIIGLDVHKDLVYVTVMEKEGKIKEQYEMENSEESWNKFVGKYILEMPEIALEVTTSGKHVARILSYAGFSVHITDPKKLALIFKSSKKNDKLDSEEAPKDPIFVRRALPCCISLNFIVLLYEIFINNFLLNLDA